MCVYKKYDSFFLERNSPVNLISKDKYLFSHESSYLVPSFYIKSLKSIDILRDTVFKLSDFTFYSSDTHINGVFSFSDKINYLKLFFTKKSNIKQGVWITQNWTWMYFHWLTDALTRLIAIEDFILDHLVILPVSYQQYSFIEESLSLLGYKIFWNNEVNRIHVDELLLPSQTSSPGNFNDKFLNKLRSKFLFNPNIEKKAVYLSRLEASKRHISNELELIKLLRRYGVEIHIFENYSFEKQVRIMNQTSILIGLHGAGLTNMLFMNDFCKVLEIRNFGDKHNNCYFSMASALKHDYYYCQGIPNNMDTSNAVIELDLIIFEKLLQEINLPLMN
jgi:capsular polysaccharide biosynthesis protein